MAVTILRNFTRCQVRLQSGTDGEGHPVYVSRIFSRIKPDTTNQDLYDVIMAILSLQDLPVHTVRRLEDGELIDE
jgi:hypothetical protein